MLLELSMLKIFEKKEEKRNLGGKISRKFQTRGRIYDITRFLSIRDNEIINDD